MAIDVQYGGTWTSRRWTNGDGKKFEFLSDSNGVEISGMITMDTDVSTFKAQFNNAIQDMRTYRRRNV